MSNKYFGGVVSNTNVVEDVDADLKAVVLGTEKKLRRRWKTPEWQML